jgi:hypothetical protein
VASAISVAVVEIVALDFALLRVRGLMMGV